MHAYKPVRPLGPLRLARPPANRIGDAATCGGLFIYLLRGGTLAGLVQATLPGAGA